MVSNFFYDLRFALRSARRQPMFSIVVIVTLALVIAANTAMFATVEAALLKPLPFQDPGRLVFASCTFGGEPNPMASAPDYYDYREQADRFEALSAILVGANKTTVTGGAEPERVSLTIVSDDLFRTLGVTPVAGRWFTAEEGRAGGPSVAMVSERFALRRFGSAGTAVGAALAVDGQPLTIIGVMPAAFRFLHDVDIWVPMRRGEGRAAAPRHFHNWLIVGRLRAGVSLESAQRQVDVISKRLEQQYPASNRGKALRLDPLQTALVGRQMPRLVVLMAAVGLVLLIACGNVAGLLLVRGSLRRPELALRAALGASRARLVAQLLAESVTLALIAGVVGMALAFWLERLLPLVTGLREQGLAPAGMDWPVLAFALALSVLTGVLFGAVPALRASSLELSEDLAPGARTTDTKVGMALRGGLVIGQVAASLVLLIGAGLLVRSFTRLAGTNPGFDVQHLLTGEIQLLAAEYPDPDKRIRFFDGLREDLSAIHGVRAAGFVSMLPIRNRLNNIPAWAADHPPASPADRRSAHIRIVLPGYFDAVRIRLLAGRDFGKADRANAPPVVIINELMARTLFPGRSALGQRVMADRGRPQPVAFEVIGVVGNARVDALDQNARMTFYLPYYQSPAETMRFAIRTDQDPESITQTVRRLVLARDRDIPVENLVSMERLIGDSLEPQRVTVVTLTVFSVVALLLACLGLYGVVAYSVSQRTHEIGVRMALGAEPGDVLRLVVGQGAVLAMIGVGIGVAGAIGLTHFLAGLLFEVRPTDPVTFATVSMGLVGVALLASLVPARRAAKIDPMIALRYE